MRPHTVSQEPEVDLNALCKEARRRGISYGQLVARTSRFEQEEIVKKYIEEKKAAERAASEQKKAEAERKKQGGGTWGGRRVPIDRARARELYDQGKLDLEIAMALGCSPGTVCSWRNAEKLPAHGKPARIDEKKAMELYGLGWSDGQIGDAMGVTGTSVRKWRTRRGLAANYEKGGRTQKC